LCYILSAFHCPCLGGRQYIRGHGKYAFHEDLCTSSVCRP
jgi:hypothetical protein